MSIADRIWTVRRATDRRMAKVWEMYRRSRRPDSTKEPTDV